ncbi:hypothetical protein COO60DRAFT_1269829 [Scenedesmus sp. NREL 46B-D3]|nr:hypothetical protein COO60DRAFT_1269829 [Scenedesmus sp. NREL 46B-D3]
MPCSYTKRCSLLAPCCEKLVCCYRCHDKANSHRLPRHLLQEIMCNACRTMQPLDCGATCLTCDTVFAAYFCTMCGIANDDVPPQGYFHCVACGICRVGSRGEYFHCDGCSCCLMREVRHNHICRPNCLDADCPICLSGPLFDSQSPARKLPCGHMAHATGIKRTAKPLHSICTTCSGSAGSSSAAAAAAAAAFTLPPAGLTNNSSGSSSSSTPLSDLIRDLLDQIQPAALLGLSKAELLPIPQELEQQQLLQPREVRVSELHGGNCKTDQV